MKILLIMILMVSCGRKTPSPQDFGDSDGDQISNYVENGINKFIANIEVLPEINGVMTVGSTQIAISNETDLKNHSLELLTWNLEKINEEDVFNEWSKLKVVSSEKMAQLGSGLHEVTLNFDSGEPNPHSLWLIKEKASKKLAPWSHHMKIKLTAEDIKEVIQGKAYIAFSTLWSENSSASIREKTYRVFMHDGQKGMVKYISYELPFKSFLKEEGINDIHDPQKFDLFSAINLENEPRWWVREINANEKVIIFATPQELSDSYLKSFDKQNLSLKRLNGRGQVLNIEKAQDALVYIDVKGFSTKRSFRSYKQKRNYSFREIIYDCKFYYHEVSHEQELKMSLNELLEEIKIEIDGKPVDPASSLVSYQTDQDETFGTLKLKHPGTKVKIEIISRDAATYVTTGLYKRECPHTYAPKVSTQQTNIEGRMELSLETYVEKL
jgi:hypothetical protein